MAVRTPSWILCNENVVYTVHFKFVAFEVYSKFEWLIYCSNASKQHPASRVASIFPRKIGKEEGSNRSRDSMFLYFWIVSIAHSTF